MFGITTELLPKQMEQKIICFAKSKLPDGNLENRRLLERRASHVFVYDNCELT